MLSVESIRIDWLLRMRLRVVVWNIVLVKESVWVCVVVLSEFCEKVFAFFSFFSRW